MALLVSPRARVSTAEDLGELTMSRENRDEGPTRLFGGEAFRQMLRDRLGGVSSHDVGPEPRSRIPPGCVGSRDPMAGEHRADCDRRRGCTCVYHRDCVVADRWARACAVGNCQYWDPQAMKPDHTKDCPGHRGDRRLVGGRCVVIWPGHCARRTKWGEVHEQTGKHARPVRQTPLLPGDRRAPWEREPGED